MMKDERRKRKRKNEEIVKDVKRKCNKSSLNYRKPMYFWKSLKILEFRVQNKESRGIKD